jgi:hypothetical protein
VTGGALSLEEIIQDIGALAVATVGEAGEKILIFAEVEDGLVSSDLFYGAGEGDVRFLLCPPTLEALIQLLWDEWRDVPGNREWQEMAYGVADGGFTIDLAYPDEIEEDEDFSDRRPRAIAKHFGVVAVDYSNP